MKHKILILGSLVTALSLGLASCGEGFLYKAPQGAIDQSALSNAQGAELLCVNAYASLTYPMGFEGPSNWVFGSMYGGDAHKGSTQSDQSVLNAVEKYAITNTNSYLSVKWRLTFYGVKRANLAMNVLEAATDMDASTKAIRVGEMKFLRAFWYFEGVKMFGPTGCPFIDEATAAADNDPKVHNGTDIYPNIISDLQAAISALPATQGDPGRANQWAAKALLAKVYMQKGDMASAKPILKDIVDNGLSPKGVKLALRSTLDDNWNSATEHNSESIFEIEHSMTYDCGGYDMMLNFPYGGSSLSTCCGFFQPSYDLADSYKVDANGLPYLNKEYQGTPHVSQVVNGTVTTDTKVAVDPRLDFTVGRVGIPYMDWGPMEQAWVRDISNGGPFEPKKHVFHKAELDAGLASNSVNGWWAPGSAKNMQYLSLRDIKLLYAECLANDGDLAGAMQQVNDIRNRAASPTNIIYQVTTDASDRQVAVTTTPAANYLVKPYPSTHAAFSNKDVCIKAIRMERKLELGMEGVRFYDLARWGGAVMRSEVQSYIDYDKQFLPTTMSSSQAPSADKLWFPIPLTQIQTLGNDESGAPYLVQTDPWKE